eukprot:TRINITY_DN3920_c0_g1_i1.p1 TRINITY_DN3920_c0_g1~~TRINITY_DN3920_c0_g1_i1.p1  ORF type:complete len:610 (+),score=57.50 TRINITY_DN3920_c0_g1_i1:2589-4418(+)
MQQIRKDHMNETSILQNEIKEMQAKILSLQKENELHKADVAEKEDTINYLREVREQITKQNEELLAEIRKAANNSKAESTAGSPVTREQLVKKRKNKTKPVIERTKRPAIPLNRIKFTGSLVPQHVFAFNVQQEIFKEKMDPENLVVESKVLRIDYNQGKLNVESKEVPMDKETIEKGRRMMLKSRTYAKLTTEFNDFLKLSSTNVKNQPQITKKSFTLINPERVVQQIENIPNEGTEISLMPAIKEPQIIIMQDINKEVPHDLRALLEEKDRIIESLRADNKSLVERLQNRRASMRRKSALGPTDSHSDNEEGEFLDPNFYGDPNKEGLFLFYEETEPTTIESEGKIRGRPDRSKLLLDKILAQANVGNVKVNSRMIHKFVNKVYQEVIATYKESLETLDTPFHLKRPLVFQIFYKNQRVYVYQMLLNYYGMTHSAENKYAKLLKGVIKHKEGNHKLTLFASFMEITPYNEGDFEFYIKGYYFINKLWYYFGCDVLIVAMECKAIQKEPRCTWYRWLEPLNSRASILSENYEGTTGLILGKRLITFTYKAYRSNYYEFQTPKTTQEEQTRMPSLQLLCKSIVHFQVQPLNMQRTSFQPVTYFYLQYQI